MSAAHDPREQGAGTARNVDPAETARFGELADTWWDPSGPSRPLHLLNPVRLAWVLERSGGVAGRRVLDVGCGAGLLAEALAAAGAQVSAIDASPEALAAARLHRHESGLTVDYQEATAEEWAEGHPGGYDVVTCMELIEHVPDPASLVDACARLLRPGGDLFLSTINRTPKAWLLAVVAAEYVLGMLPRGTHDYRRLVRPSELAAWGRAAGLSLESLCGLRFNPLTERFSRERGVDVNYMAHLRCAREQAALAPGG
jgi:2-polyprenyl-6-hydroxyphenyl methylase/3-demethylubiquinone-9 3-methyltransferase